MKPLFFIAALIISVCASAQESKILRNTAGLFADWKLGGGAEEVSVRSWGVEYKRFFKPNVAYRISVGVGEYSSYGSKFYYSSNAGSIITSRQLNYRLPMGVLGGGLEAQRKFIGKLYFYGAADLQIGVGNGYYETVSNSFQVNPNNPAQRFEPIDHPTKSRGSEAIGYRIGFSPAVGFKLNFKRIILGTEFSNPIHFVSQEDIFGGRLYSGDFYFGSFNQRAFISYRF